MIGNLGSCGAAPGTRQSRSRQAASRRAARDRDGSAEPARAPQRPCAQLPYRTPRGREPPTVASVIDSSSSTSRTVRRPGCMPKALPERRVHQTGSVVIVSAVAAGAGAVAVPARARAARRHLRRRRREPQSIAEPLGPPESESPLRPLEPERSSSSSSSSSAREPRCPEPAPDRSCRSSRSSPPIRRAGAVQRGSSACSTSSHGPEMSSPVSVVVAVVRSSSTSARRTVVGRRRLVVMAAEVAAAIVLSAGRRLPRRRATRRRRRARRRAGWRNGSHGRLLRRTYARQNLALRPADLAARARGPSPVTTSVPGRSPVRRRFSNEPLGAVVTCSSAEERAGPVLERRPATARRPGSGRPRTRLRSARPPG